jgi:hypothetical protein
MATVKFGGGITAMSGSIAGNTFARGRFGYYVRSRTKPVNPKSAGQSQMRSIMAYLAEAWHEILDATMRTAWETYAQAISMKNRLGETIKLTGFQMFIRSNSVILQHGNVLIDDGPAALSLPAKDPTFSILAYADTQKIHITYDNTLPWAGQPNGFMEFWMGRPQLATRNFFNGPWRNTGTRPGASPPPTPPTLETAIFTLTTGQKIWVYARISEDDGRLSERFQASTIVIATTPP